MADWTFEEFKARQQFQAQFLGPIADNVRRCLRERIAAALEWSQYGPDGAQGAEILPKFAADYGSERGFVEDKSPVLMVVPAENVLTVENAIPQEQQIDARVDIHRDIKLGTNGGAEADRLTAELWIYIRAMSHVILSMLPADLVQEWPAWSQRPGGIIWNITEQVPDGLRKGGSALKRSGRIRLEVKTVEA